MNLTFSSKKNNSNHRLVRPKNAFLHKIGKDFVVDWLAMLILGVIIVVLYLFFGYMKYESSTSTIDSPSNVSTPVSIVKFNDKRLDTLLKKYTDKSATRADVVSGKIVISDPGM